MCKIKTIEMDVFARIFQVRAVARGAPEGAELPLEVDCVPPRKFDLC